MGWPMGLSGMFGAQTPEQKWQEVEDRVTRWLENTSDGELALTYKMLYARGYRIATVNQQIAEAKKKC